MYTRSILVEEHSRAVLRLSGECGAATSGSSLLTSILRVVRPNFHGRIILQQMPCASQRARVLRPCHERLQRAHRMMLACCRQRLQSARL